MNDVSAIGITAETTREVFSPADTLFSADFPLFERFRVRGPAAFLEERSSSRVQIDACESASKPAETSSKLPSEEDAKNRKSNTLITIRCTMEAYIKAKPVVNCDLHPYTPCVMLLHSENACKANLVAAH
jgi:hypothetical protein